MLTICVCMCQIKILVIDGAFGKLTERFLPSSYQKLKREKIKRKRNKKKTEKKERSKERNRDGRESVCVCVCVCVFTGIVMNSSLLTCVSLGCKCLLLCQGNAVSCHYTSWLF